MARYTTAGTLVQVNINSVFTNIDGVESFSGPSGEKAEIDTTSLADTAATFLSGLPNFGDLQMNCMDNPADAGNAYLLTRFAASNVTDNFKIILPFSGTGNTLAFNGYVKSWKLDGQKASPGRFTSAVKLSGNVTRT